MKEEKAEFMKFKSKKKYLQSIFKNKNTSCGNVIAWNTLKKEIQMEDQSLKVIPLRMIHLTLIQ